MRLQDLFGQEIAKEQLRRSLLEERISHAYLFSGPPGVGKKTAALAWAQALNCLYPVGGDACDACPACRKVANRTHPDVLHIVPEGESIHLEQVREVRRRVLYQPYEGQRLVVILSDGDRLTAEAANALLKSLEEPAPWAVFVLVSDRPQDLLPTIRSRCQPVNFRPLPRQVIASFLKDRGISEEQAGFLASLAGGSLARAEKLQADETARRALLARWQQAWRGSLLERLSLARELANRETEIALGAFLVWLRDLWVWQETGSRDLLRNPDLVTYLPGRMLSHAELGALRRCLVRAWQRLAQNAQKQLLWEEVLLGWPSASNGEGRSSSGNSGRCPVSQSR